MVVLETGDTINLLDSLRELDLESRQVERSCGL